MYSTTWCGYCRRLKLQLDQAGLDYREVDIERDADADVPLRPAEGEIAEAMWVTRADLRVALRAGDWGATEAPLLLPGKVSIARSMLESWAAAD